MKYHIVHKTWYAYSELAPICHNLIHLAPRATGRQTCVDYRLSIDPEPAFLTHRDDCFGNRAEYFSIEGAHQRLEIIAQSTVELSPIVAHQPDRSPAWETCLSGGGGAESNGAVRTEIEPALWQFTFPSPRVPQVAGLRECAAPSFPAGRPILAALAELAARIHGDFRFDARATTVDTPLADVLRLRRGVCQDFAHLATGCLRAIGLPARYTSGYLRTSPPPGRPRLVGADASHAWSSCWCGPLGWIDFDPTNNCFVGDSHVTVAWGRDYSDVCPIQGVFVGGGHHRIGVSVEVAPLPAA
jgi:transglutaminase-like putative cysteine protease